MKQGVVEALAEIIKEKEAEGDYLAEVKSPQQLKIPAGMRLNIRNVELRCQ